MQRLRPSPASLAVLLLAIVAGGRALAAAPSPPPSRWHDVKCVRYTKAWSGALARWGTVGLGRDFLDRHAAFLASNCTRTSDVCPRSAEELKLANIMVILAMNAGTASTFPPFACRP